VGAVSRSRPTDISPPNERLGERGKRDASSRRSFWIKASSSEARHRVDLEQRHNVGGLAVAENQIDAAEVTAAQRTVRGHRDRLDEGSQALADRSRTGVKAPTGRVPSLERIKGVRRGDDLGGR
jgi:hypothetical protein